MIREVWYHPLAELELNEVAHYYERECPGLGCSFLATIERCTERIIEHPEAGTPLDELVHRRLVPGFPYGVLYRITADEIRILAIMNLRRRPSYWAGRR